MTARSPLPLAPFGLRCLAGSALVVGYCLLIAPPVFKWDSAYLPRSGSPRAELETSPRPGLITPTPFDKPTIPEATPSAPVQPQNAAPTETRSADLGDRKAGAPSKSGTDAPTQGRAGDASAAPTAPPVNQSRPNQSTAPPANSSQRSPSLADLTTPRPPSQPPRLLPEADIPNPATASTDFRRAFSPQTAVPTPLYQQLDEATLPPAPNSDFLATVPPQIGVPTSPRLPESALADGGRLTEPTAPAFADPFATGPATAVPPGIATAPERPARPTVPPSTTAPPARPPRTPLPGTVSPPPPPPEVTTPDQAPVSPSPAEDALPPDPDQIFVQQFQILGSTVFSQQDLAEAALTAVGLEPREIVTSPGSQSVIATRGLTLAELVQAADAITQRYLDEGYISSGAYLDQASVDSGSPVLQIIEGQLEAIAVTLAVPQQTIEIQAIPDSLRSPQPIAWEQSLGGLSDAGIIIDDADLQPVDLTAIGADSRADRLGDPTDLTLAVAQQVVADPYSALEPDSTARQNIPLPERTTPASLRFDPATEAWQAEYAPHLGTRWLEFTGIHPLDPGYIGSRLALAGEAPLNINRLVEGVQLLQLDPIIDQISTEIIEGSGLGTSRLNVRATQADTDQFQFSYDNSRSPSVGSIRQGARFTQGNLLGFGDSLQLSAGRSQGSEDWDVLYTLPLSPYNTTLTFNVGASSGEILDTLFSSLDILSSTRYTDITLRQPLYQTPTDEFALSLGLSHTEAQSTFLGGLGFPTAGADSDGFLRITALRFGQDWVRREANQVIALQSTFSLGLDTLGATVNDEPPDTRFQSWQGNAQWARLLAPDLLLLVRGSLQFADRELPPTEQISIGGVSTVRGYRQNTLLTDNGWTASAELQIPVLRIPEIDGLLQIAPFFDAGGGSFSPFRSSTTTLDADTLASVGLGIIWKQSDYLNARLDWGYRLSPITYETNTLQESGIHFSIIFTPSF